MERDPGRGSRPQGYRININEAGLAALRRCLPNRHFELYRATSHRQHDRSVDIFDTRLVPLLHRDVVGDPEEPSAVDRETLRAILSGAAGDVRFGVDVVDVRVDGHPDGRSSGRKVVVTSADGQTVRAGAVIVADGAGSRIRRRWLPSAEPRPTGQVAIYGRTPLDSAALTWMPRGVVDQRVVGVTDSGTTTLILGAWYPRQLPSCAASLVPGMTMPRDDPYVMWVLLGPESDLPGPDATADDLHRFASHAVDGWHPAARQFVTDADVADTFRVTIVATSTVAHWPTGPVAFLGDAIHAMSPAGGEGANTAFADAADLVEEFVAGGDPDRWLDRYQRRMRERVCAQVAHV